MRGRACLFRYVCVRTVRVPVCVYACPLVVCVCVCNCMGVHVSVCVCV